jgi:SAM-dependent methyltransferase
MPGYYSEKLAAERLRSCYEIAPPRVRAYLDGEIEFVLGRASRSTLALELGCGYGRVLEKLIPEMRAVVGVDTSLPSLKMALEFLGRSRSLSLLAMDAVCMGFRDRVFDLTICIQNGISAFATDVSALFKEAVRVTRSGGVVLFSSYSPRFWRYRLEWFELQASEGLLGEIDYEATGDGVITCKDGFRATTMSADGFRHLAAGLDLVPKIVEIEGASLFCEVVVP